MGQGDSKQETWEATNLEISQYIGGGKFVPDDAEWFDNTNVKPLSFDSKNTDWRWSMNNNQESQEFQPEYYQQMTCQQAIDWYVTLKSEAYCLELQEKFLMRENVDCVRNEEHKKNYCQKDSSGQWVFNDIRDLMFVEEMKVIKHVFDQPPAVDAETGTEVPILDKRINKPFTDRGGNRIFKCTPSLFEELNCSRDCKTHFSFLLLILSSIVVDVFGI